MATETKLGTVNVFPSADSYDTNKGSVGDSDISFVPLTGTNEEVVASSFSNSGGYIKYVSGLLICTSCSIAEASTITFPQAFSAIPAVTVTSNDGYGDNQSLTAQTITTTSFYFKSHNANHAGYIAIGKWN